MTRPLWIVRFPLETLQALVEAAGPLPDSPTDHDLVVEAMAEYLRFAGTVPTMPALTVESGALRLQAGNRFVEALVQAGTISSVPCLVSADSQPSANALRFTADAAAAFGSDARVVRFARPLEPDEVDRLKTLFAVPPTQLGPRSYGWTAQAAARLPAWAAWRRALDDLARMGIPIDTLNGRSSQSS